MPSIQAKFQKCGKPNCWCHNPNQKGHGPYYHLINYNKGKYKWTYLGTNKTKAKKKAELILSGKYKQIKKTYTKANNIFTSIHLPININSILQQLVNDGWFTSRHEAIIELLRQATLTVKTKNEIDSIPENPYIFKVDGKQYTLEGVI